MKTPICMAIAALLSVTTLIQAQEVTAPSCHLQRLGSVELTITPDLVLVPLTIGDQTVTMALNTSFPRSYVTYRAAEELRLPSKPVPNTAYSGKRVPGYVTEYAVIKTFAIGDVLFANAGIAEVESLSGKDHPPVSYIGHLGMDLLRKVDFELDLAHKKLTFFSQDHCDGKVVYWAKDFSSARIHWDPVGTPYVPMTLDGKTIEAGLSTGGRESGIYTDATRKLYGFDEKSADVETVDSGTGSPVFHFRAMKLTTDGLVVTNANMRLTPAPKSGSCAFSPFGRTGHAAGYTGCAGRLPAMLGRDVLDKLRLFFAMKEGVVYFTRAEAVE